MKNFEAFKEHGDVIWNIANLLRGLYRPPQYRRVMIPLTVLRRLDCVLEATKEKVIAEHRKLKAEGKYDAETIEKMINRKFKLTFHNTSDFTFRKLLGDPDKLAPNLAKFISGFSTRGRKITEKFNFTDEIEKLEEANRLFEVIKQVAAVDLHKDAVPNIAMGYVFEDLVRRFNEQANEEAGDHFTPREVIKLMVHLLFTYDDLVYKEGKVIKIYDPTCGTGGMLSESEKLIADPDTGLNPSANLELFGQEYNPEAYAICGSDLMIKGEDVKTSSSAIPWAPAKLRKASSMATATRTRSFIPCRPIRPLASSGSRRRTTSPRSTRCSASRDDSAPVCRASMRGARCSFCST